VTPTPPVSADAIVVGAGICGAAAAFFLQERGMEVLLLDRGPVSAGTTGLGEGNVLVCDKPAGPERELALLGRELWVELGERFPAARVTRKGALLLDHPDGADGTQLEPSLAPGIRVLHEPADLQVDPGGLTRALAAELRVREGAAVASVARGGVTLQGGERLACEHVVVATGPWAGDLTGLPVEPRKGQLVGLAAPRGLIRHKLIEASYMNAVAGSAESLALAVVVEQTLDGDEVLVGSSRERVGFDPSVRQELIQAMLERAARFVPALSELPPTRSWCGFRPWLPDGLPAVGPLEDGVWTSTGHEGAGVCLGPISGRLLASMICGEQPELDPAPFDPRRFSAGPASEPRSPAGTSGG
jgi:glycine/D-amino acid oxidase-like deaminating enzyme